MQDPNLYSKEPLDEDELREVRVTVHRMRLLWAVWGWLANAVHDRRAIIAFAVVIFGLWGPDIASALVEYLEVGL